MPSLRSCLRLTGVALGCGLVMATQAPAGPEHVPAALPIATVQQPATLPILPTPPAPPAQPAGKPQPHFLWYQKDFEPAPDEGKNAKTLKEFASNFIPTAGKHEAVFLHPWTKQPVRVWFNLPRGKWQVSASSHVVAFTSSQFGRVQIVFQPFGKVTVERTSGGAFEGGG